jgi:hypothetical protein
MFSQMTRFTGYQCNLYYWNSYLSLYERLLHLHEKIHRDTERAFTIQMSEATTLGEHKISAKATCWRWSGHCKGD